MPERNFWTRFREARMVPVLLIYLLASWGILLLVSFLQDRLGLPGWVDPVAFVLLLVGLFMVSATAWVLSHSRTKERRSAGEVPGNWDVAPRALVGDLVLGQVPHLTWARSLLGGVFALGTMFAFAGLVALLDQAGDMVEPVIPPEVEEVEEVEEDSIPRDPGPDSL